MNGTAGNVSSTGNKEDEQLNEEFHTLLREAAEKREGRAHLQRTEDDAAAKQESADLIGLARDPKRYGHR
jgi:hypothetical protein